jgi:hypothetical protein
MKAKEELWKNSNISPCKNIIFWKKSSNLAQKSLIHVCDHCHVWLETQKLGHLGDSMTIKIKNT